jgi:secondary thiamine-phosphate synthase enzyme
VRLFADRIELSTDRERALVDVTLEVQRLVRQSGVVEGICALYAHGATAALMIQENDDPNIGEDVVDCLDRLVPKGVWRHDRVDGNGASHIQAGIVGPSETIPVRDGKLDLSTWQNVFFCEFDGPRRRRTVAVTILGN